MTGESVVVANGMLPRHQRLPNGKGDIHYVLVGTGAAAHDLPPCNTNDRGRLKSRAMHELCCKTCDAVGCHVVRVTKKAADEAKRDT